VPLPGNVPTFDTVQTFSYQLIVFFEQLEHLSFLLSVGEERSIWTPDVEECVLDCVKENPGVSMS
jgi:hypothetical protein